MFYPFKVFWIFSLILIRKKPRMLSIYVRVQLKDNEYSEGINTVSWWLHINFFLKNPMNYLLLSLDSNMQQVHAFLSPHSLVFISACLPFHLPLPKFANSSMLVISDMYRICHLDRTVHLGPFPIVCFHGTQILRMDIFSFCLNHAYQRIPISPKMQRPVCKSLT